MPSTDFGLVMGPLPFRQGYIVRSKCSRWPRQTGRGENVCRAGTLILGRNCFLEGIQSHERFEVHAMINGSSPPEERPLVGILSTLTVHSARLRD
jgi:hypothetical protein